MFKELIAKLFGRQPQKRTASTSEDTQTVARYVGDRASASAVRSYLERNHNLQNYPAYADTENLVPLQPMQEFVDQIEQWTEPEFNILSSQTLNFEVPTSSSSEVSAASEKISGEFESVITDAESLQWLLCLAEDSDTNRTILASLAGHSHPEVRIAVADNRNTPGAALKKLACDESPDVRFAIAENHNVSAEILQTLTEDPNPYVAHRASQTLKRITNAKVIRAEFGKDEQSSDKRSAQ